jgi:hypothetical protein
LVGEGLVSKGTIHTPTQGLGVGTFPPFQILLESFPLLVSTSGESKNEECHHNVLLPPVLA